MKLSSQDLPTAGDRENRTIRVAQVAAALFTAIAGLLQWFLADGAGLGRRVLGLVATAAAAALCLAARELLAARRPRLAAGLGAAAVVPVAVAVAVVWTAQPDDSTPQLTKPAATRPLCTWFSDAAIDHYTTSDPQLVADNCATHAPRPPGFVHDYVLRKMEGRIIAPQVGLQPGTKPVCSWYSAEYSDQFITSKEEWVVGGTCPSDPPGHDPFGPHWTSLGLEGYIYISPRPGTIALCNWWDEAKRDNLVVSDVTGDCANHPPKPGITYHGIEGYILDP